MKILYISPINTVGTLDLWKRFHELNGHQCDYITLFKSPLDVKNGITNPILKISTTDETSINTNISLACRFLTIVNALQSLEKE